MLMQNQYIPNKDNINSYNKMNAEQIQSQSTSDKKLQSVSDLIKESTSFQSRATKVKWNQIQMWLSMRH